MGIEKDRYSADTDADGKVQYLFGTGINRFPLSSCSEYENVIGEG